MTSFLIQLWRFVNHVSRRRMFSMNNDKLEIEVSEDEMDSYGRLAFR